MDNDIDNEMEDFEDDFDDDIEYDIEEENTLRRRALSGLRSQKTILILGGIGILILIALVALFFRGGDTLSNTDLHALKAQLDQLEKRLTRFEWVELKVNSLEKKQEELEQYLIEADTSKRRLTQQYNTLSKRMSRLQKGKTLVTAKAQGTKTIQRKSSSQGKKRFHKVRSGETLYRISRKYGISVGELCRLNNISKNQAIQPGQKLVVSQ